MRPPRQVVPGVLAALLSILIVIGGFSLALRESQALAVALGPLQALQESLAGDSSPPINLDAGPLILVVTPTPTLCPPPSGWEKRSFPPGSGSLANIASLFDVTIEELAEGNCLPEITGEGGVKDSYDLNVPRNTSTPTATHTQTPTATESSGLSAECWPNRPFGWVTYKIRPGDTLFSLAKKTGSTILAIKEANCLGGSSVIRAGDTLYLRRTPDTPTPRVRKQKPTSTPAPPTLTQAPPTPTALPSATPRPASPTPTLTQAPPSPTVLPSATPSPTSSLTPSPTHTPSPTLTPSVTWTVSPTASITPPPTPINTLPPPPPIPPTNTPTVTIP